MSQRWPGRLRHLMPRRHTLKAARACAGGLAAAACALAAPLALAGPAAAASGACTLPVVHDTYDGFHIGVPSGWYLSTLGGLISVAPNAVGTEEAVVYPALQTAGLTPSSFFGKLLQALAASAKAAGNSITYRVASGAGGLPVAIVRGTANHTPIQGQARVTLLPGATAVGSGTLVFSAYWAPAAGAAKARPLLAAVAPCYGPEAGTLYHVYQDQVFTYPLPEGWTVKDEGQDNLDITGDGGRAYAGYVLMGPLQSSGVVSAAQLLQYVFGKLGITISSTLSTQTEPTQQTSTGMTQSQEFVEFLGSDSLGAIHGLVDILSVSGGGVTSGTMRLGVATAGRWNADNGAIIHVMDSIQHSFTQDLQQWQQVSQQMNQFSQQVSGFDDALNGVDLVQDPSTGEVFQDPYSNYEQEGPNGPGYYDDLDGNPQKLNIITPGG